MGYVMMAVPAELVQAVSEFIESRDAQEAPSPGPEATEGLNGWDARSVRFAYGESADEMRRLLDFLAERPDREVSADDIAEALGARFGWNTVAGMLGAFSRRCKNRYGRSKPMWRVRSDGEGRVRLMMPAEISRLVLEARKEAKVPENW